MPTVKSNPYLNVQCIVPHAPTNGRIASATGNVVEVGSSIHFYCSDGFQLIGSQKATCGNDGKLVPMTIPTCQAEHSKHEIFC